ncbi:thioredoxin domain-containing protein [Proteiniclasticum sp. SCR006]|uniref:Thioredoxin domain-containing protein n=2 Tax=Proteiniclasticum aestuarii TaxID=2817862 RepID=A0A939HBC0_9CLOT|nr:thioredoxin domain-containing protein [Proteiniclasticum aestuarii]
MDDGMNRLKSEQSPYLLQHAENPVDWYPFGEEAFEEAKRKDRPVFLSIGYSSCHWCHVMREESFEDEEVAEILNRYFISVKVDREERPDVDHVYMSFCQAMTGHGGWPMTILMTGEGKPFYAATYLPRESRQGQLGLKELLLEIHRLWVEEREKIVSSSEYAVKAVKEALNEKKEGDLSSDVFRKGYLSLKNAYDEVHGGFYIAPKFPVPHHLLYLLRYWHKEKEPDALEMVEKSLLGMYQGGIFDHLGYGFSRYTVDERWLVPHFEKMLYDNALLLSVYTETYQASGKRIYKEIAEKIIAYIDRVMTTPEGAFYSAEDADSEGEEGKFYLFTREEVLEVLGEEDGAWFSEVYGITSSGNFEGKNILNLLHHSLEALEKEEDEKLVRLRRKLFAYREKRVKPGKDDKILSSWNGLMISALAYAGKVFQKEEYVLRAEKALRFMMDHITDEEGNLYASYRERRSMHKGFLDSYAFLLYGVLSLQEATLRNRYLHLAEQLAGDMVEEFYDKESGLFRLNGKGHEKLVLEAEDIHDSALPSGNSMAAASMGKLWSLTGKEKYKAILEKTFNVLGGEIMEDTMGFSFLLTAYRTLSDGPKEVVLSGKLEEKPLREMKHSLAAIYLPEYTVVHHDPKRKDRDGELFSFWREPEEGKGTAYVCRDFTCSMGIHDAKALLKHLREG